MENWEKAIELQYFIRNYIPTGFREPIGVYSSAPYILEDDYIIFDENSNEENFEEIIKTRPIKFFGRDFQTYRFDRWDVIEAIKEYFKHNEDF